MARELVETTDYSVERIAVKCGYRSRANFVRQFKHHHSQSPTKLRASQAHRSARDNSSRAVNRS